jgi:hypothetical protein
MAATSWCRRTGTIGRIPAATQLLRGGWHYWVFCRWARDRFRGLLVGDLFAVMLNGTSRGCSDDAMVPCDVPGDAAHCSTLQTTLGIALGGKTSNHPGHEG